MMRKRVPYGYIGWIAVICWLALAARFDAQSKPAGSEKIFAQKLVEEALAAHSELMGLELASTPPKKTECVTIASSDAKGIGQKCDNDEFTAMKTNKPFIEKEKENGQEVYDVTLPIHDARGKIIATAGLDFKPEANQREAAMIIRARQIAKQLEAKINSKSKLFEAVE